jgi:type IV pilus assembly protein PilV
MVTSMAATRLVQRGASMVEVLVTMVIIAFGLLGMAGLQMRLQSSEMESYQRSQALLLLNDMANRIAANRGSASLYAGATTYGSGMTCPTTTSTTVQQDLAEWCAALQGAAEVSADNLNVGAMIGGRGCVQSVSGDYLVSVAWQGLTPISAPPAAVTCGLNAFNTTGTSCVNDLCRRVVTTLVRVANLN